MAFREYRSTWIEVIAGAVLIVGGGALMALISDDRRYVTGGVPIAVGVVTLLHGAAGFTGYKSFVAWRYLLVHHQKVTRTTKILLASALGLYLILALVAGGVVGIPVPGGRRMGDPLQIAGSATAAFFVSKLFWGVFRYSKPAMIGFLAGLAIGAIGAAGYALAKFDSIPFYALEHDLREDLMLAFNIVAICGGVIAGLAAFFGTIRVFFTFFTTVPIGGVWIGTASLIAVLSVMSGFETDLREKILGSSAHIQVTREDGDFVDWREVKEKIDRVPGVVASTPYAISEVVLATNSNGINVVIKGIDPKTVGTVTDLVDDLVEHCIDREKAPKDRGALQRLAPLVTDPHDRAVVPVQPRGDEIDPAPGDLPRAGDPIDFSKPAPSGSGSSSSSAPARRDPYGGDAVRIIDGPESAPPPDAPPPRDAGTDAPKAAVIDPPPSDVVASNGPPVDYSEPQLGALVEPPPPEIVDLAIDSLSPRTQALPGILVGCELIKQTRLFRGEEVRAVSPLSDPSNPDATGTPVPYYRDFRVAGLFFTGMYEYDLKFVYVTLDSLQNFLDRGDAVDGIEVRVGSADDTARFIPTETSPGLLREALGPGYRIVDWRELNRSLFSALKLEKIAMFLVLGIVILVASFSIIGNLIMVVVEKAKEIALLKTLGASDFGVTQMFAIQGLLIGVIGTLLGMMTGLAACWAAQTFGIPLSPEVYYIDKLPIHVDWESVAAVGVAGVAISLFATLYPALLAARVRPATGLRQ